MKLRRLELRPEFGKEHEAAVEAGRAAQVSLGIRIRILREQSNLTQTKLGVRVGISQKYISQLECGRKSPSFETLVAIAKFGFRMPLSVILFGVDDPVDAALPRLESLLAGQPKDVQSNMLSALQHMLRALGSTT